MPQTGLHIAQDLIDLMLAEAVEDILPTIADEAVRDKVQDAINEARISFH